jgi:predicted Na+-dependent transporter
MKFIALRTTEVAMSIHLRVLAFFGSRGPTMLLGGVLLGLAAPWLADVARPLMGVAVFIFTTGAFLKVDHAAFVAEASNKRWIAATLAWSTFGVPLLMLAIVKTIRPDPALAQGLLLCALAPPVGAAAAIAAMLRLNATLALLVTVLQTAVTPLYLPALSVWLAGYHLSIDPVDMTVRLLAIVGGAGFAAGLLRRYARTFVSNSPDAMTGIAVLGLILVSVGAMRGMQTYLLANPGTVAMYVATAFLVNVGFQAVGAALFLPAGTIRARTVGLLSGNRNVTLMWVAAGTSLSGQPHIELLLAMSLLPIFMLPAASNWLLGVLRPLGVHTGCETADGVARP